MTCSVLVSMITLMIADMIALLIALMQFTQFSSETFCILVHGANAALLS